MPRYVEFAEFETDGFKNAIVHQRSNVPVTVLLKVEIVGIDSQQNKFQYTTDCS
jgi:hypothetical protein